MEEENQQKRASDTRAGYARWIYSKINWGMVPIKVAYFFLGIGMYVIIY